MNFEHVVSIDGYQLPEPAPKDGYTVNTATIVDSGRNLAGYVIGVPIRHDVMKISLTWSFLTASQWREILALFSPAKGGSFYRNVKFYNPYEEDFDIREMYVSDRNAGMWRRNPKTGDCMGWVNAKLSLIEV